MSPLFKLKASIAVGALLLLPLTQAQAMVKAEYKEGKTRISDTYKADKAACAAMAGNAKDICVEQAKAKEKVERADLEYSYTGKAKDQNKVLVAKAESSYAVAKERCDDKSGNDKDVCVKEAKAVKAKALADAKMGKEMSESRADAGTAKRDADYDVAAQKCDALSGDAKASCMTTAKAKYGKN